MAIAGVARPAAFKRRLSIALGVSAVAFRLSQILLGRRRLCERASRDSLHDTVPSTVKKDCVYREEAGDEEVSVLLKVFNLARRLRLGPPSRKLHGFLIGYACFSDHSHAAFRLEQLCLSQDARVRIHRSKISCRMLTAQ